MDKKNYAVFIQSSNSSYWRHVGYFDSLHSAKIMGSKAMVFPSDSASIFYASDLVCGFPSPFSLELFRKNFRHGSWIDQCVLGGKI